MCNVGTFQTLLVRKPVNLHLVRVRITIRVTSRANGRVVTRVTARDQGFPKR